MKSHSIASKKRTMQSLHTRSCRTRTRSRRTNSVENIESFSHTNRSDSLTEFNQIRKVRICTLRISVCSQCMSRIRCSSFISISRSSSAFHISLTYLMNFLQSNCIDIESLMLQEVSENSETQWCYQIMMWSALSSISHYSDTRYLFHNVSSIQF